MRRFLLILAFLALTMGFGPMPAYSIPVSFDLFYIRGSGISPNNTFVDTTIFLDDADISGGTVQVALSAVDATFRQGTQEIFFSFANNRTDTTNISPTSAFFATFIPFTARFVGNTLTGLNGIQPLSGVGIASLSKGF